MSELQNLETEIAYLLERYELSQILEVLAFYVTSRYEKKKEN